MKARQQDRRPTVAIAGATGFVGKALLKRLLPNYHVVGLTRSERKKGEPDSGGRPNPEWRRADLFSLLEVEKGLKGADYAFYLVHSMVPSARLTQGKFQDMDLILADNFARAAKKAGIKQIIYLGGLIPEQTEGLASHLHSRLEVEEVLRSHGVPVTVLRAGIVVGANGSSFCIIPRLIRRLPVMICPGWMSSTTHPIALQDVVELLAACIGRKDTYQQSIDIGGPDMMTYSEMILHTARVMGKKRRLYPVPFFAPMLSGLWMTLTTGVSLKMVKPLIGSLRYSLGAKNRWLQEEVGVPGLTFEKAVRIALEEERKRGKEQRRRQNHSFGIKKRKKSINNVRSVQRLILPKGWDAAWTGKDYAQWLPCYLKPFIIVREYKDGRLQFLLNGMKKPLLELKYSAERSTPDRVLYYITGGFLAHADNTRRRGRLEFREVLNRKYVIVAIHEFIPKLPWLLYSITQALVHLWVMRSYGRHLRLQAESS
ncbi:MULTISPECIES: NAD(P)H-binding protein [Aneurinibacillus]|jgi:uncharacterized protein YbjT (DUF2867 family)|uniref:Nucleoside-diphosphate sugar epimerase n=1 Tax=Aneurinibacillus danicus TaxID=267746 RepID=A0A511V650_9BACL|nr:MULTISPECIES: NAD(P)H-binding protein [Aneurinibacillus]GEN32652.1 nucleoside-diphosphate sugar epimerase [Aneurinibacillus danicus]